VNNFNNTAQVAILKDQIVNDIKYKRYTNAAKTIEHLKRLCESSAQHLLTVLKTYTS